MPLIPLAIPPGVYRNGTDLPSREDRARWRWTDSGPLTVAE
jgi:hypothetical protein